MPLSELKPDGFCDEMQHYAVMTRAADMYVQGFALRQCGVWLRVDGGGSTLIGYGDPDEALAEAEAWATQQLSKVRQQIAERKRCMPSNAKSSTDDEPRQRFGCRLERLVMRHIGPTPHPASP